MSEHFSAILWREQVTFPEMKMMSVLLGEETAIDGEDH